MKKKKYSKTLVEASSISTETKSNSLLKNKGFWGLVIIIVMIGSVFSFSLFYSGTGSESNTLEYNNYKFVNRGKGWETKLNGQDVSFYYSPNDVMDIPFYNVNLDSSEIYFVMGDSDISEYGYEISRLKSFLAMKGIKSYVGCFTEDNCGDYPIVNCSKNKVLVLKTSERNSIYTDGDGCVVIEGKTTEYIKSVDRFIYALYGVI